MAMRTSSSEASSVHVIGRTAAGGAEHGRERGADRAICVTGSEWFDVGEGKLRGRVGWRARQALLLMLCDPGAGLVTGQTARQRAVLHATTAPTWHRGVLYASLLFKCAGGQRRHGYRAHP